MGKKIVIAILMLTGLLSICGEPVEDVASTLFIQLSVFVATWSAAFLLAKKWNIH